MMEVEVVEIFPKEVMSSKDRNRYQARGGCHVKLPSLGLHLRNVGYWVTLEGKIVVKPPFRVYAGDRGVRFVRSVEFEDGAIWKRIEGCVVEKIMMLREGGFEEQLLLLWDGVERIRG